MFFDTFSSIFELYVGANLASIISKAFNQAIEDKVLSNYKRVTEWEIKISSQVQIAKSSISSIITNPIKEVLASDKLNTIKDDFSKLNDRYEEIDKEIKNIKSTESIKFIHFLSAFCGLYSVSILVISGFCQDQTHSYLFWNSLVLINIFSTIFIVSNALNKNNISYPLTFMMFCLILLAGFIYYWIIYLIDPNFFYFHLGYNPLVKMAIISSLIIPILHYILFIAIGSISSFIKSKKISEKLIAFNFDFQNFQGRLNTCLEIVQNPDLLNPVLLQSLDQKLPDDSIQAKPKKAKNSGKG